MVLAAMPTSLSDFMEKTVAYLQSAASITSCQSLLARGVPAQILFISVNEAPVCQQTRTCLFGIGPRLVGHLCPLLNFEVNPCQIKLAGGFTCFPEMSPQTHSLLVWCGSYVCVYIYI